MRNGILLLGLCSFVWLYGGDTPRVKSMDVPPLLFVETIPGLKGKVAHHIIQIVDKLEMAYDASPDDKSTLLLLKELKEATEPFSDLKKVTLYLEKKYLDKSNPDRKEDVKMSLEYLRVLIRPTIISARKVDIQQGYIASFVARMRNAANNLYEWVFPSKKATIIKE